MVVRFQNQVALIILLPAISSMFACVVTDGVVSQRIGETAKQTDGAVENDKPAASSVVSAAQYCETIADFFCDFYLRCGRVAVADREGCLSLFLEGCNGRYERRFGALAQAGLLQLSRQGVDACRAHLQSVECTDQLRDLYGPCQQMWQGTQPEGRACGFDVESFVCAPGNSCVLDLSLCGTCRARLPAGASCAETAGTCGPQGDCRDGVCLARRLVGESCSSEERCETGAKCEGGRCLGPRYVAVGEACSHRSRCPFGSACLDGVCFPASAVGHRCSTTVCATGFCDATETCVPLLPAEGSCASHEMCASGRCADGRCQAFPSACLE